MQCPSGCILLLGSPHKSRAWCSEVLLVEHVMRELDCTVMCCRNNKPNKLCWRNSMCFLSYLCSKKKSKKNPTNPNNPGFVAFFLGFLCFISASWKREHLSWHLPETRHSRGKNFKACSSFKTMFCASCLLLRRTHVLGRVLGGHSVLPQLTRMLCLLLYCFKHQVDWFFFLIFFF